ncbi:HAD family hydrolase [Streptomyces sp. 351MFTsu5.1]|uniref:HAD family hydrolase n=1 Tax=Streptomyces sp. 351MFTsu5.1 TaxID=1172180 RepID=UPI0003699115|nr:HAD-IA family hydrolase [Streptomyces sp. 351MFTsu5.1]
MTAEARAMLARARGVLFDFDGPLCKLFPRGSSRSVADVLRLVVSDAGLTDLLVEQERTSKDPHLVLRAIHRARSRSDLHLLGIKDGDLQAVVRLLEQRLTEGEMAAALIAQPPPADTRRFVRHLADRGLSLAVVTNNAPSVADRYLRMHGLRQYFKVVHGRTADPDLMKPHPDVLFRALDSLGLAPGDAVMIGDTNADLGAAEVAGVLFIGYDMEPAGRAGTEVMIEAYGPLLGGAGKRGADGFAARFVGEAARRGAGR